MNEKYIPSVCPILTDSQKKLAEDVRAAMAANAPVVNILAIVQRFIDKESSDHEYRAILVYLTDIFANITAACDADARDLAGYAAAFMGLFDEFLTDWFVIDDPDEDEDLSYPAGWENLQRAILVGKDLGDMAWLAKYPGADRPPSDSFHCQA